MVIGIRRPGRNRVSGAVFSTIGPRGERRRGGRCVVRRSPPLLHRGLLEGVQMGVEAIRRN